MTKLLFKHPRCKHGMIKTFCDDCRVKGKRGVSIYKAYNKTKKRKNNGQFDLALRNKVANFVSIGVGASLIAYSAFFYLPINDVQANFVSPLNNYSTPGGYVEITPTPDPIRDEIVEVFGEDAEDALKIAECESRFNPNAVNRNWSEEEGEYWSTDRGIFQINDVFHPAHIKFYFDYKTNIAMAYKIFKDAGNSFSPWTCKYILNK